MIVSAAARPISVHTAGSLGVGAYFDASCYKASNITGLHDDALNICSDLKIYVIVGLAPVSWLDIKLYAVEDAQKIEYSLCVNNDQTIASYVC
jgi:hypothetical protein